MADDDREPAEDAGAGGEELAEPPEALDVPGVPDDEALDLESRRRIYQLVKDQPGIHMREIGRQLEMPMGTLEYHLHYLTKAELLAIREEGRYTRYFVTHEMDRREKDVLSLVRQETPRRVIVHVLQHPGSSHGEILEHFDMSASTLSFHLKKLLEGGLLEKQKQGRSNLYTVAEPELVAKVIIQYKESFVDDVVDRFADVWLGLEP